MLPFDFDYYKPVTVEEAVELFHKLDRQGKQPMYYSGGTELITLGRINIAFTEAVVDLKDIRDFHLLHANENQLILGSALPLTKIEETNVFPFLTNIIKEVADHTAREKITLGGNICARIFYREAVLPFLLTESEVVIAGTDGKRIVPISEIFHEQLQLQKGEILVQLMTDIKYIDVPFVSIKRRQQWETGYPLITIAALMEGNTLRVAVSGLCPFPFRSKEMEAILNNRQLSLEERIGRALSVLPEPILDDVEGSADYRIFVLKNLFSDVITALED